MPRFYSRRRLYRPNRFGVSPYSLRRRFGSTKSAFMSKARKTNVTGAMYKTQVNVPRPLWAKNPFPPGVRRTLTYGESFTMTTGSGVYGNQQQMRLNSIFDPNVTGTGHQPYGHDEMGGLYARYRVDKVRFTLLFTTPGATNDIKCAAQITPNNSAGLTSGNIFIINETPMGLHGKLSSSGDRGCVLSKTVDMPTLMGIKRAEYQADDRFSAAFGANPTSTPVLTFATICYDGTNGITCQVDLTMEYDCWFYDRETLSSS